MGHENYNYSLRWVFDAQELHEIDAKTLLKSEQALIEYIHCLSKELNLSLEMKVKARKEGSFETEHIVEFLSQNRDVILVFLTVAFNKFFAPNPKPKDSNMSRTQLLVDIQEKINSNSLTLEQAEAFIELSGFSRKQKNAFFKVNKANNTIKAIEVKQESKVTRTIKREDFSDYIIESTNDENILYDSKIYIISPVIVKGSNELWSGEFEGEKIRFYVKDKEFLEKSQNKVISFNTGFFIICNLRKSIKIIDGREQIKWDVMEVSSYATNEKHIFEFHHTNRTAKNNIIDGQLTLFD